VLFLGRVGTALVPTQLAGFLKFADHPDYPALHSRHHFLGELTEYEPFRWVRSRHRLPAGDPWATEVTRAGRPVMPVAIALEYAAAAGDWVSPPGWPVRHLAELRDVWVDLDGLAIDGDVELDRTGLGATVDGRWCVDVLLRRGGREVLRARLVYSDGPGGPATSTRAASTRATLPRAAGARTMTGRTTTLSWRGRVLPAVWWAGDQEVSHGAVRPTRTADLWAQPTPPRHALPTNAVEAVVAAHVSCTDVASPSVLEVRSLRRLSDDTEAEIEGAPGSGRWTVRGQGSAPLLVVEGVSVR
jgi:hypothetical protein